MGPVFKIAFRNLKEHKTKTLIVGTMIALGIAILVVGNSLIDTAAAGIKKNYIENFTGHIMIAARTETAPNILGMSEEAMEEGLRKIPDYKKLEDFLKRQSRVESWNGQTSGMVTMSVDGNGMGFSMLFGIDPVQYQKMFPGNLTITEGSMLGPKQEGILLSNMGRTMLEESTGKPLNVGDYILLNAVTASAGTKIREVTVRGFFTYKNDNALLQMISLVDIQSLRSLQGLTLYGSLEADLSAEEAEILGAFDEESLFNDFSFETVETKAGMADNDSLFSILGDTSDRDLYSEVDSNAYHFLLVRLDSESAMNGVIDDLRKFIEAEDIDANVYDWAKAAGQTAELSNGIKIIFNVAILIIAVVALIIIMNTLVISVSERIPEIGTMRAIGAQKNFVRIMIMLETLLLSVSAGAAGIILGTGIIGILQAIGIGSANMFLRILFGGSVLYPVFSWSATFTAFLSVIAIGILAGLYPVSIALKIKPVKAMQA